MPSVWNPKVSIIIPVYNGANYVNEAIDSALTQTYPYIEVIVVNDGSCDEGETERIALSYGDRIKYIKKQNGGVSSALNEGIRNMTGDYFSWLSHDDVYGPDKIRHQIESLAEFPDKKAVALCAHCFINENSARLTKKSLARYADGIHEWQTALRELLKNGSFCGCALLLPKTVFEDCGFFHEGLRFSQDMLMWMEIFLHGYSLVYNANEDVRSRIHGKQVTETARKLFHKDSLAISEFVIARLIKISDEKNNYLYLFAKRNAKYGNREVVKACLKKGKMMHLLYLVLC